MDSRGQELVRNKTCGNDGDAGAVARWGFRAGTLVAGEGVAGWITELVWVEEIEMGRVSELTLRRGSGRIRRPRGDEPSALRGFCAGWQRQIESVG